MKGHKEELIGVRVGGPVKFHNKLGLPMTIQISLKINETGSIQ